MKKFILILFSVILSISIYGCSETSKYKTKGFSIEASSDYNKFKHEDYELYLEDDNSFICVFTCVFQLSWELHVKIRLVERENRLFYVLFFGFLENARNFMRFENK